MHRRMRNPPTKPWQVRTSQIYCIACLVARHFILGPSRCIFKATFILLILLL